jgi:choline-sulfatase
VIVRPSRVALVLAGLLGVGLGCSGGAAGQRVSTPAAAVSGSTPPPSADVSPAGADAATADPPGGSAQATPATGSTQATRPADPPGPPQDCNVILLSIDALRADMPWNGYARPIAPRLTELESRSVSFTNTYSISSYTSMSLGGLLGGRLPSEMNRSGYFFGTYRKNVMFPQLLRKARVHTMGVMAHEYFRGAGLDAGFDTWTLVPGITWDANTDRDITSPQSEHVAEQLLGDPANATRRFFFWAHFMDPHDQYLPHEGIDWGRTTRDHYDNEVTFTDRYIGKLLDFIAAQPWAARTVIIVTSDHGEAFGEHGLWRHAFEVWQPVIRVPLMIVAPGATAHRVTVRRSGIDLAPTILDFFQVPGPTEGPPFEGKSLVKEVYGAPGEERDVVVDLPATSNSGRRRALLRGDKKIICFDDDAHCKLFDLATDPTEDNPVRSGPEFQTMKAAYDALVKSMKEVTPYACSGDCLNPPTTK